MTSTEFLKTLPRAGLNYGRHNLLYYPPHWWTSIHQQRQNLSDARKNYVAVNNRIYIYGILPEVTEEDLHEEFSIFGPIAAVVIIRNQCHFQNGFAFVTYHLEKYAQLALQGSSRRFFKGNFIFVNAAIHKKRYVNYQEVPVKRLYSMKTLMHIKKKYDKYFLDQVNDLLYVNPCHEFLQEIDATIPRHLKRSTFCNNSFSDNDSSTSADDESFSDDESVYSFGTVTEIPGTPANSESTTSENSWKYIPDYFPGLHNDNDLDDFIYPAPQYFEGTQYVEKSSNLDLHEDEHFEVSNEYSTWEAYQEEVLKNINREVFYVDPDPEEYNHWNRFNIESINPVHAIVRAYGMNVQIDDDLQIVDITDGDDMQLVAFQPNCPRTCPTVYEYPVNIQGYAGAKLIDRSGSHIALFEPIHPLLHSIFYNFDFINEIFNELGIVKVLNYANRQIKAFQGINPLVLPAARKNKTYDYMQKLESILTNLLVYVTVQGNKRNYQSSSGVHIIEISDQDNIKKPQIFSNDMEETLVQNITSANRTTDLYQLALIVDPKKQFAAIETQFSKSQYQFLQSEECDLNEDDGFQKVETNMDNYEELESKVVYETTAQGESWEESSKYDFSALSDHDVITQVSEVEELDAPNQYVIYEEETRTVYATCSNVAKSEK